MTSLNPIQPENVAHGSELQLQVFSGGTWVDIAEISEIDYDADEMIEGVPVMGSRITGYRRGRYAVAGTIKGYWLNGTLRAMLQGAASPTAAGNASSMYLSQAAFNRYQIIMVPTAEYGGTVPPPSLRFINVVLGKDTNNWSADKLTTESVTFTAEDIMGQ